MKRLTLVAVVAALTGCAAPEGNSASGLFHVAGPADTNLPDPAAGLTVRLLWNAAADLDLHVLNDDVAIAGADGCDLYETPCDCYFANPSPDWWAGDDDVTFTNDTVTGGGLPENINLPTSANGSRLRVVVHYYFNDDPSDIPDGEADPFLVISSSVAIWDGASVLPDEGWYWEAGTLEIENDQAIFVATIGSAANGQFSQ